MGRSSGRKGARTERELIRELDARGWWPMKAPASGAATGRDLPDLIAGNGWSVLVCEVKTSGGDPVYLDREEVDALVRFARAYRGSPWVVVRWSSRELRDTEFYFAQPWDLYETASGSRRVKYENCSRGDLYTLVDVAGVRSSA